ncbi:Tol-Pal envelope complex beta propeller repeat protein TolB [Zymomonas mobilis subsp. mobilis ZM4 = ATCC 31821]|uniref:Tol-Pal system protein TolB n=2 Tax=Zymomonas mobilis subsp. mobilis TaxID=120045 RepID=TOLB_ZYMMO|nr:Tol-Pal system beta propeller repeat protein TolB [Zymomonas mobilis]Q5NR65.1 RecName: Full=Tol-Pal system protein TolB; Flags: Precursor [Zymomonas mobilis subsp. mobilis ZM4 = ATCC 31821]AAV88789.1 Tol-Pal system beta propeller repeat protein TolB [Zymomonas mobilis subsp. mobilis ZM4 = ATCC 31821]ACV75587.1 Tol-Pal system beta propeller repeat protein TolB [Zymomonas mobilis subsp. mobilis NCIMB 11163]AEH62512.1 Tol-Pal system beta propeller repeat protein TolB [Zymomonas mobilis subsp. m
MSSVIRKWALTALMAVSSTALFAQNPAASGQAANQGDNRRILRVDITGGISQPMPIAVPVMPTPSSVETLAGTTAVLGRQVASVISNDLKSSGLFTPSQQASLHNVSFPEVTAPQYSYWLSSGAQALVQGFVQANGDGTLTVGCYLYDVFASQEMLHKGFVVKPADWRRAAHKCADAVYTRLTGEGPYFDSRIVYISETGPKNHRLKRLAIMDQDGANHRFLTNGQSMVLTPRFAPNQQTVTYLSYVGNSPRIYVYTLGSGHVRLVVNKPNTTFAPRFSPDGKTIVFSMSVAGNTDIYKVPVSGGQATRLTTSPGIDTAPSFSPDGSKIVFESDRSGSQQIYIMNADGSNQNRISFGSGRYATPVWSPRGDLIAFTKLGGGFHVGVMKTDGSGEQILTNGWQDEGPSWSPNGRVIAFFRTARNSGHTELWSVDLTGVNERHIPTPLDGSDPSWGPLLP